MDFPEIGGYKLKNVSKMNIVLGKNGSGKSLMFRQLESSLSGMEDYGKTKYITPERGGAVSYMPNVDDNMKNPSWIPSDRRKNQSQIFRHQTISQYLNLELEVLREFEKDQSNEKFDFYMQKINSLLENIEIVRKDKPFKIITRSKKEDLKAEVISSGESELISLSIECLVFIKECVAGKKNMLFLDEPDVHLHPDLQVRLMEFLEDLVVGHDNVIVFIATHSTAILSALQTYPDTRLALMKNGQQEINFTEISDVYKKVLPVFGAHPLSNVFNEAPILLLEGEDDERIWQQAVRSAGGKLKLYPCVVDGISNMSEFELETQKIISTVYDQPKAYSLRDRDEGAEEMNDLPPIIRMKLSCRSAENLLLTDEVLEFLGTTWEGVKKGIDSWLETNEKHPHYRAMREFKEKDYDRKNHDLKEIRIDLMGIIGSNRPWEVAVGKTIAQLTKSETKGSEEDGKILSYLGKKVVDNLIQIPKS